MVQFEEQLEQAMRLKWRAYYMNYRGLKDRIEDITSQKTSSNTEFIRYLKAQCLKVIAFYDEAEARLRERVLAVVDTPAAEEGAATVEEARLINVEFEKLRNYAQLNVEGLRKIAKKYDKNCGHSKTMQGDVMQMLQGSKITAADTRLDDLTTRLEAKLKLAKRHSFSTLSTPMLLAEEKSPKRKSGPRSVAVMRRQLSGENKEAFSQRLNGVFEKHEWSHDDHEDGSEAPRCKWPRLLIRFLTGADFLVPAVLGTATVLMWKYDVSAELDWRSYFTIFVTLHALYLLVDQQPPDVILLFATLVLRLAQVLDDSEAWGGFSNDVVLSVAVLGIVSAGVHRTGVVEFVLMQILGSPKRYAYALFRLCVPVFMLNVCISNTCVMGVLIPVIDKWSKDIGLHPALFLMPMSYLMLISGTFAIFSTSSNLIAQGLLVSRGLQPFESFDVALLCLACTLAAFLYTGAAVPFFLSRYMMKQGDSDDDVESSKGLATQRHDMKFFVATMQITAPSLDGVPVKDAALPGAIASVAGIVRWERMGTDIKNPDPDTRFKIYDVLYICCKQHAIGAMLKDPRVTFTALDAGWEFQHDSENRALVEVVLDGLCPLINQQLVRTSMVDTTYSANCIAIRPTSMQRYVPNPEDRQEIVRNFVKGLRSQSESTMHKFQVGDNLLLDVPRRFFEAYRESHHFASVALVKAPSQDGDEADMKSDKALKDSSSKDEAASEQARLRKKRMILSGSILVVMIALVASSTLSLLQASLLATFALVGTGCLPQQDAFSAIKIRTILAIVGAFGIGKAMGKTRVAKVLATMLCTAMLPLGPKGIYAAIFGATVGLGIVFHATAVVILMFPICTELSSRADLTLPLHRAVAVLMMGAGCQMLSPVSYQTNLMAFASGHYTFADFPRLGIGVVVLVGLVTVFFVDQLVA